MIDPVLLIVIIAILFFSADYRESNQIQLAVMLACLVYVGVACSMSSTINVQVVKMFSIGVMFATPFLFLLVLLLCLI